MINQTEIWKDCVGYEGLYQVSNLGRIYNVRSKYYLNSNNSNGKYCKVTLTNISKQRNTEYIHRLVLFAFVGSPKEFYQANHINEIKNDNRLCNLEWCSAKYNCNFGTRIKRLSEKKNKSIVQYTKNGEFVAEYISVTEASQITNINIGNISRCCTNNAKTTGGYIWKFKEVS